MIFKDKARLERESDELKGATNHKFNDLVWVEGTGRYEFLPKGKKHRVHSLVAKALKDKQYATVTTPPEAN